MSKRAEKAAMRVLPDYPLHGNIKVDLALYRTLYQRGYEQAEKETIERAVEYIKSTKIFGRCFPEDFREALEKE